MTDEEATTNQIPVTINVTQHTAFKLPYCAPKLNRGTKGKMEEGKNGEQRSEQDGCEPFGHATHDAQRCTSSLLMICELGEGRRN